MTETPKSVSKKSWAELDELERKSEKVLTKKEKLIRLIDEIYEEDDKVFAKACLEKLNRMVMSDIFNASIVKQQTTTQIEQPRFKVDNYKLNFHCTTYHWISDCRPKSRIQIKSETHHNFLFKVQNDKPYIGVGEYNTEWYELGLNDIIIEFLDEFGSETKLKVKLIRIAKPVEIL